MKNSLYLTSHGILTRQDNTLLFINKEQKTPIPFAQVKDIHSFGKVSLRSGVVDLLAEHNIPMHMYSQNQMHISSLLPRSDLISGKVVIEQARAYLDSVRRGTIAATIVEGTRKNMLANLQYYLRKGKEVELVIEQLEGMKVESTDVATILGEEGNIWKTYYTSFAAICPALPLEYRSFRPPHNEMNALISLLNSLIYTTILTQILQTYLHPAISFLHEPRERRYSLSLDLAEYYKPILCHRLIFSLVNRQQITRDSFLTSGIRLKQSAFRLVLQEFRDRLNATFTSSQLKRKISLREQMKVDCHRLVKMLLGEKEFVPYTR